MKRLAAIAVLFLLMAAPLSAQESQPTASAELEANEVIPGQYTTLRIEVLVPTWMAGPVDFPSFEMPNLRVRLPPESTGPISRRVNGETWSGVARRYLLSPMVPGQFAIPAQTLLVRYAQPGQTDPIEATLSTPAFLLTGILPKGAEDLDPFIAASGLTLSQELPDKTTELQPGEAVKRVVTASIEGASPIVLPPMLSPVEIPGIRTYPDAPQVAEVADGGDLSGTRIESVTYMAQSGGSGALPEVTLRWYNLSTGAVETASLPGADISVDAPVAEPLRDTGPIWRMAALGLAVALVCTLILRWAWPRASARAASHRAARLASKAHAEKLLIQAIDRQDYPATRRALDEWQNRTPRTTATDMHAIRAALTTIAGKLYGTDPQPVPDSDWSTLKKAVTQAGKGRNQQKRTSLPPLNPSTT
ncbi:MAG: hypothetical protein ACU0FH_08075 [Heliomarina sp.]|uniref:hypothetical protein n=1 Tax=Heliomarina sp. TaxID=2917556 RepID=UPI004058781E